MMKVAVGHSNDPDSQAAIAEVLEQCGSTLAGLKPQAGILFAAIDFEHSLILHQINQQFPGIELIGGTADSELSSVMGFQQDSLTLMLFYASDLEIRAGVGRAVSNDPGVATQQAVTQASSTLSLAPKLCLTTPESMTTSATSIIEGLKLALGVVPIFGGLTGRQALRPTHQFFKTEVLSNAVPILLFAGDLHLSCGVASGWQPVGQPGTVTKSHQNVVAEIDGKPALEFYSRYLGGLPPSAEYPLAVFTEHSTNFYLRAPHEVHDLSQGIIKFAGDVPEGAIVQITEASRAEILAAAKTSMQQALDTYPGAEPSAALFFSCMGRRQLLGMQIQEEYQLVNSCLSAPLPSCGFYTYGEISPFDLMGATEYHNETFVTLLFGTR
jgi:hypothetical protein